MDTAVDVKKISEQILTKIRDDNLENDIPDIMDALFPQYSAVRKINSPEMRQELIYLKLHEVHYEREIISHRRITAPAVKLFKRIIRRAGKFLGEPMADEINEYHRHMIRLLEQIAVLMEEDKNALSSAAGEENTYEVEKRSLLG